MLLKATLIFLPIILAKNLEKFDLIEPTTPSYIFSLKLLQLYQQHDLVLHVDNYHLYAANNLLAQHPILVTLYNHDQKKGNITRPQGLKCINVVTFQNPLKFSTYLNQSQNLNSNDVVVFVTKQKGLKILQNNFMRIPNLNKFGRVLVLFYQNPEVTIYNLCFYCGPTARMDFLEKVNHSSSVVNPDHLLPQNIKNFNGYKLQIAYIDYFPYIYCEEKSATDASICRNAIGVEFELLQTLQKSLNFSYELIEIKNHSYGKLFRDLQTEKYDFAIGGITMTNERRKTLLFSDVLKFEPVVFNFIHHGSTLNFLVETTAANLNEKILLVITLLVITALICYAKQFDEAPTRNDFLQKFCFLVQASFEQAIVRLQALIPVKFKVSVSLMIVILFYWTWILNTSFRSKMTASMIHPPFPKITPAELLDQGYQIVMDRFMSKDYLKSLRRDRKLPINRATIVMTNDKCQAMQMTLHEKFLLFGEMSHNLLNTKKTCPFMDKEFHPGMFIFTYDFRKTPFAWAFKNKASFVASFNKHINRAMSGGFVNQWFHQIFERERMIGPQMKHMFRDPNRRITFRELSTHFFTYLVMMGAALVCFLGEVFYYRYQKKHAARLEMENEMSRRVSISVDSDSE